ncbi:MAG TPA: phosphonopyruvate decarboxylase [Candidatus Udaeobacter sp.]|jgi:phosphonopyruvate decarboxylase|nr:phosphonopyruvate decarboxylase [Candidatus Udaeobacter sp.]
MISAFSFIDHLRGLGYSQYAGVPCSFLTSLINYVIGDPALDYVGATSEGEAVGITFGAFLAGRKTVTICQNSGLGNMVNPLTSLNYPFRVPTLLIVTWRGQPEVKDEPQHEQMGRIMHRLLETLEIPWLPFPSSEADIAKTMAQAEESMEQRKRPFALVVQKGSIAPHPLSGRRESELVKTDLRQNLLANANKRLTRAVAIELILDALVGDEAIIATTGKTGRELFTISDRANHLYVVGGMGTASAIGFGVAHALPRQPVVVIDGDGAALMKLGALATIGFYQPSNLLHIILDNEAHDSTGGQQTASGIVRFAAVAAAANYRSAFAADRPEQIREAVRLLRHRSGPSLLHVKIQPGSPEKLGRPTVKPHEVKERFSQFLSSKAK